MSIRCPNCHFENPEDSHFCSRCATPLPPPEDISAIPTKTWQKASDELTRGTVFAGRYEVIEELGRGGMGKVYRVEDKKIKEEVVLKFLKPEIASEKRTIERFGNELKLARRIIHKNVCRMYDLNEEKGTHYISMEYVPGEDLKRMVGMSKQMSVSTAVSIAQQVCEGLAEAHRLGVVHRDLKSSNVMIDRGGNARILDFGIARSLEAKGLTGAGVMIGTPEYMSPEQAEGREADQRSDIYSLGVIMYEMVTGRVPFEGETPLSVAVKHKTEAVREPRKLNAAVPEELSRVIMKCLEKDRSKRYQRAQELLSVLNLIEKRMPGGELIFAEEKIAKKIGVKSKKAALVGIMAAVLLIIIVLASIYLPKGPTGMIESIAVLPFKNVNADPDIEYLSDGITETIISKLTQLPNLKRVIARSSVFRYKGESIDPKVVGQELGVDALLVSQMSKRGEELSISVELINVRDGSRIWGDRYLRKSSEVFKIEEEITSSITENLRLNLKGLQLERMAKRYTNDPEAFTAYTRGRFLWNRRTEDDLNSAIKYFEEAIRLDPNYALAYTGLSHSYLLLPEYGNYPPKEAYPKVRNAALKALELDSMLSEAHVSLAQISLRYDHDWEDTERRYKRAIELDPGNSTAHHWYAYDLMCRARFDEAIKEMKRAYELDPLSLIINRNLGQVYYRAGQYDKALEALQKTYEMDPNFSFVHYYLGLIYLQRSMYEEALAEFQTEKEKARGWGTRVEGLIGIAYIKLGMRDKAQEVLNELIAKSEQVYVQPTSIAILYFVMGENEQGFKWLDKAYDEYDSNLRLIKVDPFYERVRSDPRFKEMMKKAGVES